MREPCSDELQVDDGGCVSSVPARGELEPNARAKGAQTSPPCVLERR